MSKSHVFRWEGPMLAATADGVNPRFGCVMLICDLRR
jgi:hypothetical protein